MNVTFKDNSDKVLAQLAKNELKALIAVGTTAVELTKQNIVGTRYGKAIVDTGTLRDSITKSVRPNGKAVDIGTNIEYSGHVHFGTSRMPSRPFLADALLENTEIYKEVAAEYLGEGFGGVSVGAPVDTR